MSQTVVITRRDGNVAILMISNPPVNALSYAVRDSLWKAVSEAEADDAVEAIVIGAMGRTFPAGADITEFTTPAQDPGLSALCTHIENCTKPVIAALHGTVLGGGFELALAAHYRIAALGTRIGFPEVNLGLIPGAGGTQRAPRLAGAANALSLMLTGRPVPAASAMGAPYIDEVTQGNMVPAAIQFAKARLAAGDGPRRSLEQTKGLSDPVAFQTEVDRQAADAETSPEPAKLEIIRSVEAALLLPAQAGMAFETAAFEACNATPQARALQHVFFAERMAAKPPVGQARKVVQLGLAGDGVVAVALASAALDAGLAVAHLSPDQSAREALSAAIKSSLDRAVEARHISKQARRDRLERLVQSGEPAVIAGSEVVIGCGADQARLITATGAHAPPFATVATTSLFTLVDDSPLLGLHLDDEASLAEVFWSEQSVPDDVATLMALMRRLRRDVVAERTVNPLSTEMRSHQVALADALITHGVPLDALRDGCTQAGLRWPAPVARPSGQGVGRSDVVPFLRAGMAAKGMRLMRDTAVARGSDLDILALRALGYARWSGGPMHMAQQAGLLTLQKDMRRYGEIAPELFPEDPALEHLIRSGRGWEGFAEAAKA